AVLPLEVRWGCDGEPFALRTALGWTVQGAFAAQGHNGNGDDPHCHSRAAKIN
ncbi:hypothetical protein SK128_006718, partial [Halocaridina rubra]